MHHLGKGHHCTVFMGAYLIVVVLNQLVQSLHDDTPTACTGIPPVNERNTMKFLLVVLLSSLAFGCNTLNRVAPLCRVILAPDLCEAVDVVSDVVEDTREAIDTVTGEEEE